MKTFYCKYCETTVKEKDNVIIKICPKCFRSPIHFEVMEKFTPIEIEMDKEYCENCNKLITDEMKYAQQVIYSSAEHTLSAPTKGQIFPFNDPMFNGPFCCQECFNEIVGINLAYKKGRKEIIREELKFLEDLIEYETIDASVLVRVVKRIEEIKEKLI